MSYAVNMGQDMKNSQGGEKDASFFLLENLNHLLSL
jgi:hypothetical protein